MRVPSEPEDGQENELFQITEVRSLRHRLALLTDISDKINLAYGGRVARVSVLSPSDRTYDGSLKRKHYLESDVTEGWLVDIESRSIEIWQPGW